MKAGPNVKADTPLPMICPECRGRVRLEEIREGRCRGCNTRICIPRSYYLPGRLIGLIVVATYIYKTYSHVLTSDTSFVLLIFWIVSFLPIQLGVTWLALFVTSGIFPPEIERIHANDTFTRMRLDD